MFIRPFMIAPLIIGAVLAAVPQTAMAGTLALKLTDQNGKPVTDAVVTVYPSGGIPGGPISFPWGTQMVQQDIAFSPHVLIVPVGATVRFPNHDKVRHHVYSFSKPAKFEIKLFGKDETRSYTFTTAGAVGLGCNIHDQMSGFIKVVDTPFAQKSDGSGQLRIAGVPSGTARVIVWHPLMRSKDNEMLVPVPIGGGDTTKALSVTLRSAQ